MVVLFGLAEWLETCAAGRARDAIAAVLALNPDTAVLAATRKASKPCSQRPAINIVADRGAQTWHAARVHEFAWWPRPRPQPHGLHRQPGMHLLACSIASKRHSLHRSPCSQRQVDDIKARMCAGGPGGT